MKGLSDSPFRARRAGLEWNANDWSERSGNEKAVNQKIIAIFITRRAIKEKMSMWLLMIAVFRATTGGC
jgi:hypothetical protein